MKNINLLQKNFTLQVCLGGDLKWFFGSGTWTPVLLIILCVSCPSLLIPDKVWVRSFSFFSFNVLLGDFSLLILSQLFDLDFFGAGGTATSCMFVLVNFEFPLEMRPLVLNEFLYGEINFLWDLDLDFFSTLSPFSLVSLLFVLLFSLDLLLFIDFTLLSLLLEMFET